MAARGRSRSGCRGGEELCAGCSVRLRGLKAAPELNGQLGTVDRLVESSGRWRVRLSGGQCKDLKPDNLEVCTPAAGSDAAGLHPGCKVELHGLKGAVELNGQEGILEFFVEATKRWRVKLSSGQRKDLKADNLRLEEPELMFDDVEVVSAPPKAATVGQPPPSQQPAQSASAGQRAAASGGAAAAPAGAPAPRGAGQAAPEPQRSQAQEPDMSVACDDAPGSYIISGAGARVNNGPSLSDLMIAELTAGTLVEVVEVRPVPAVKRVRARIANPAGWISLLNMEDGHRFAVRDDSLMSTTIDRGEAWFDLRGQKIDVRPGEACGPDGRFVIAELLGAGAYSTVWLCNDVQTGVKYALKFTRQTKQAQQALTREIMLMNHLSSKGNKYDAEGVKSLLCLAFPEAIEFKGHLGVLFEPMKCNLLTALERHGQGKGLPLLPTVRNFSRNLFLALRALRKAGLVHLDVKPENLLVAKDSESIKLSDFGCTLTVAEIPSLQTDELMPRFYRAPEVILGQAITSAVDVWSAGITVYQMATDRLLFSGSNNNQVMHEALEICGAYPSSLAATGKSVGKHFAPSGDFLLRPASGGFAAPREIPMSHFEPASRPVSQSLRTLLAETPKGVPADRHEFLVGHLIDLLSACLRFDTTVRASADDALAHRFFAKGAGDTFADLGALWAEARAKK